MSCVSAHEISERTKEHLRIFLWLPACSGIHLHFFLFVYFQSLGEQSHSRLPEEWLALKHLSECFPSEFSPKTCLCINVNRQIW